MVWDLWSHQCCCMEISGNPVRSAQNSTCILWVRGLRFQGGETTCPRSHGRCRCCSGRKAETTMQLAAFKGDSVSVLSLLGAQNPPAPHGETSSISSLKSILSCSWLSGCSRWLPLSWLTFLGVFRNLEYSGPSCKSAPAPAAGGFQPTQPLLPLSSSAPRLLT